MKLTEVQRGPVWENIPKQMSGTFSYQTYDWVPHKIFSVASFLLPPIWICLFAHLMPRFSYRASICHLLSHLFTQTTGATGFTQGHSWHCEDVWNVVCSQIVSSGVTSRLQVVKMLTCKESILKTRGDTTIMERKMWPRFSFCCPPTEGEPIEGNTRWKIDKLKWRKLGGCCESIFFFSSPPLNVACDLKENPAGSKN